MNQDELAFDDEYLESLQRLQNAQGFKKAVGWYEEVLHNKAFNTEILKIRRRYSIPDNGFEITTDQIEPPEWKTNSKTAKAFYSDVQRLAKKFGIESATNPNLVAWYIFYNDTDIVPANPNSWNLFCVSDVPTRSKSNNDEFWPVTLCISPYASKNDLLDFVKTAYTELIAPLQAKHRNSKIKIGKIRAKNMTKRDRNSFIFQNRNMSRKELAKETNRIFGGTLTYADINSIIAYEDKKRGI